MSVCVSMNLLLFQTTSGKGSSRRKGPGGIQERKPGGAGKAKQARAWAGEPEGDCRQHSRGLEGNGSRCKRRPSGQEGSGLQFAPRAAAFILEEPAETEGGQFQVALGGPQAREGPREGEGAGGRTARAVPIAGEAAGRPLGGGPKGGAPVEGRGGGRGAWGGGPEPLSEPPGLPRLPPRQEATTPRAPSRLQQQQQ